LSPDSPIDVGEIVVFQIKEREIPIVHRVLTVHERSPPPPFLPFDLSPSSSLSCLPVLPFHPFFSWLKMSAKRHNQQRQLKGTKQNSHRPQIAAAIPFTAPNSRTTPPPKTTTNHPFCKAPITTVV
jgi:hypothetical protein